MHSSAHAETLLIDTLRLPGWSLLQLMVFPALKKLTIKIQRAWDSVTITRDFNLVAEQVPTVIDMARLLAVYSSDWLHALPISS